MNSEIIEWLNLVFRFIHVLAAIMWIGSSIFFMWLDSHLTAPEKGSGKVSGELWMIHGGGIFHAQKRVLTPEEIPRILHWFKWEAYTTWLSGFCLLAVLYYLRGGIFLLDPARSSITGGTAIVISLAALGGGWLTYDFFWRSPLGRHQGAGSAVCFIALMTAAYALCQVFSGRAVYLHVGAMLGTMMAGNVFVHIIPNQRRMLAALKQGKPHDTRLAAQAKLRSTHNNTMTFPVLFTMLSAHFPRTFGDDQNWIILGVFIIALVTIKHWIDIRQDFQHWLLACVGTFMVAAIAVFALTVPKASGRGADLSAVLPEEQGRLLFTNLGCAACHQAGPTQLGPSVVGIYNTLQPLNDGTSVVADENYLRESILQPHLKIVNGYQPVMPPYKGVISDEQINLVIAYLKALKE